MATPVGFEGANLLVSGEEAGCSDLEAFHKDGMFISCWRMTPDELAKIVETGVVWLAVYAAQLPPTMVSGQALVSVHGRPSKAEPIIPKRVKK